jgi:hypothetical protein
MNKFNHTVIRFNYLKGRLLEWKHGEECKNKEPFHQSLRDQMKKEYNDILKEHPTINDIMPEFYCATCKHLTTTT